MKQKRYWLRIGIALVIINILLCAVAFNFPGVSNPENNSDLAILAFPNILISSVLLSPISSFVSNWSMEVTYYVWGSLCWFLIGAIVGWIYGKIKSKQ